MRIRSRLLLVSRETANYGGWRWLYQARKRHECHRSIALLQSFLSVMVDLINLALHACRRAPHRLSLGLTRRELEVRQVRDALALLHH